MDETKQAQGDGGWSPVDGDVEVADLVEVVDIAVAEQIAHPMRGRLLRRLKEPQSAHELADWLDVPVTRLYHHIKSLEAGGLIRVVATRQVGAATERRYQAAARSYRLPKELLADTSPEQLGGLLGSVFDLAKLELVDFVEGGGMSIPDLEEQVVLSLAHVQLTPARRAEFVTALVELLVDYSDDEAGDDTEPFAVLVAAFPPDPPDDDRS